MQVLLFIATRNNLRVLENEILIFHADVKNIVIRESKKKRFCKRIFFINWCLDSISFRHILNLNRFQCVFSKPLLTFSGKLSVKSPPSSIPTI